MIYSSYVDIGATELPFLASFPKSFPIPAPGVDKLIITQGVVLAYNQGPSYFNGDTLNTFAIRNAIDDSVNADLDPLTIAQREGGIFTQWLFNVYTPYLPLNVSANSGVYVTTASDLGIYGPIDSLTPNGSGSNFAVGDVIRVDDGADARATVTAVNGSGGVTGVLLTDPGSSYNTGSHSASAETGIGTGLGVNVTVNTPATGTLRVYLYYSILDVAP